MTKKNRFSFGQRESHKDYSCPAWIPVKCGNSSPLHFHFPSDAHTPTHRRTNSFLQILSPFFGLSFLFSFFLEFFSRASLGSPFTIVFGHTQVHYADKLIVLRLSNSHPKRNWKPHQNYYPTRIQHFVNGKHWRRHGRNLCRRYRGQDRSRSSAAGSTETVQDNRARRHRKHFWSLRS